jgi:hypothetical protein
VRLFVRQRGQFVAASILSLILIAQPGLQAQTHVVSPAELQKDAAAATHERQQNEKTVTDFLSSSKATKALQSAHMDPAQVTSAVSHLDDEELAQLAARSQKAQADFAAGRMSDRDLIIILLGIAVLVLIIVAVR